MWTNDINMMHQKYQSLDWVKKKYSEGDMESLRKFLEFRLAFLEEEMAEIRKAHAEGNAEELVDGLVDLCVIAIGTMDLFEVNGEKAWDEVYRANMAKEVGVKATRPNPLGLPDLIKPADWRGPSHKWNTGILDKAMKSE